MSILGDSQEKKILPFSNLILTKGVGNLSQVGTRGKKFQFRIFNNEEIRRKFLYNIQKSKSLQQTSHLQIQIPELM